MSHTQLQSAVVSSFRVVSCEFVDKVCPAPDGADSSAFDFGCFFRLLFLLLGLLDGRLFGQGAVAVVEREFGLEQLGVDFRGVHEGERADNPVAKFAAVNDGVEHAVFEEELGGLKIFGELLTYGLLDDARPGKSYERL